MSVYRVTGSTPYRDHKPGTEFEAVLEDDEERRAKARGAIRVVKRSTPTVRAGSVKPPRKQRKPAQKEKE